MAKINSMYTLISCIANCSWDLHQLDMKNAFLHKNLQEEVYMQIPSRFVSRAIAGHVCRLRCSLYDLKQSSNAWFEHFSRVVLKMRYS